MKLALRRIAYISLMGYVTFNVKGHHAISYYLVHPVVKRIHGFKAQEPETTILRHILRKKKKHYFDIILPQWCRVMVS